MCTFLFWMVLLQHFAYENLGWCVYYIYIYILRGMGVGELPSCLDPFSYQMTPFKNTNLLTPDLLFITCCPHRELMAPVLGKCDNIINDYSIAYFMNHFNLNTQSADRDSWGQAIPEASSAISKVSGQLSWFQITEKETAVAVTTTMITMICGCQYFRESYLC